MNYCKMTGSGAHSGEGLSWSPVSTVKMITDLVFRNHLPLPLFLHYFFSTPCHLPIPVFPQNATIYSVFGVDSEGSIPMHQGVDSSRGRFVEIQSRRKFICFCFSFIVRILELLSSAGRIPWDSLLPWTISEKQKASCTGMMVCLKVSFQTES